MTNSEFEYVRKFEQWDALPPSNWIVVRVDGRGFSKLCKKYEFEKPNEKRGIDLMNASATEVVKALVDVVLAYGQSDDYSFVFSPPPPPPHDSSGNVHGGVLHAMASFLSG